MNDKILVVQYDEINFALLNKALDELNYTNESIHRCYSLLESFSVSPQNIRIVLADLSNSSRDVSSALVELKRYFLNIPVILLVNEADQDTYLSIIRAGAQDALVNGFYDSSKLGHAIDVAIARNTLSMASRNAAKEYEKHFDNGPIPMWIIDEQTMRFLAVNNAAVDKYGYSKEEFSRMSILDIHPKDDIEATLESYHQKESDYYDAGYWRHVKKNGATFYVHIYAHSTMFGNSDARLCFAVDVNAKLVADQKNKDLNALMREQKEQLDSILFNISDAIWSRRADNNELLYGNNAYYKLYGYIPGKSEPEKMYNVNSIYPADLEVFRNAMAEVRAAGKTEVVYRYINSDGSLKTLKVTATYKKGINGKYDTIDGITTDITKEKELYDAIRNSEQKLLTTINNTQDLIWSVDRELKIIFCNRAFQDFFYRLAGVALDEGDYILGNWRSDSFINKRKKDYERALNGESFTSVIEEQTESGLHYYEINSSPIPDIDDQIIGVNCVSRDITAQEHQLKKIQQQNERLKEIAWIQSHKVRSPVASILGILSLFEEDPAISDSNKDLLEKLKKATDDLDAVIKEIVYKTSEIDDADSSFEVRLN